MKDSPPKEMIKLTDLKEHYEGFKKIKEEIGKTVVGYDEIVEDFIVCLMTGGHLLIEGVPGVAKTTLIKEFTRALGLSYERIQFTQDTLPADILGHYYFDAKNGTFELRKGPVFAQILMADEINRAPPKTQSALIEAMQEKQVTIEGTTLTLPEPFFVIATRNPIETEGVYPLPEAQLDRFMIKSDMGYLKPDEELEMLHLKNRRKKVEPLSIGDGNGLDMCGLYHRAHASDVIIKYIRDIILETRAVEELALGASPRAAEHLLYASKARAILSGRNYVIPDDVKKSARKVIPHRLILTVDAELEGVSTQMVLDDILEEKIEAPKGGFKNT